MKKLIALTAIVLAVLIVSIAGTAFADTLCHLNKTSPADPVSSGSTVTVTATSEVTITSVKFEWYEQGGVTPVFVETKPGNVPLSSSYQVLALGTWEVDATFYGTEIDPNGGYKKTGTDFTEFRVSNNSIPEVPLGTVAVAVAMLSAVGCIVLAKRKTQ